MRHSLGTLAAMASGHDQRSVAVLGRMAELGADARTAHEEIGRYAAGLGLDQIILVGGEEAGWIHEAARAAGASPIRRPRWPCCAPRSAPVTPF
jgi:UDP-N-acetylmuramoyl-tripeptide--D-alanyl-D-alanine ligase